MQRQATANEIALMDLVMVENWDRSQETLFDKRERGNLVHFFFVVVLCGQRPNRFATYVSLLLGRYLASEGRESELNLI